jgi:protein arginine kinase
MLHLPALGLVPSELDKVIRAAQRTGLAVRGMYGEGSRAVGDFYQISNQVTLGRTEEQLVEDLSNLIPSIADFERRVRAELFSSRAEEIRAKVDRALELLATARSIATDGAMQALSTLRLGGLLGLPGGLVQPDFGSLVIQVQKGHVQVLGAEQDNTIDGADAIVSASVRDEWRASFLRRRFAAQ